MVIKRLALAGIFIASMGLGVPADSFDAGAAKQSETERANTADNSAERTGAAKASRPENNGSKSEANNETKVSEKSAVQPREDLILLTVDKSKLAADLTTLPDVGTKPELLKTFRIAIGKEDGDKEREGDNRTPEGIYFTSNPIDGKTLPQKYGPTAIPIDFPNPIDRFSRKTGYGIWLHGVERDTRVDQAKVTEGCVAFYNSDIESLQTWLRPDQSIVVIASDSAEVNKVEEQEQIKSRTLEWAAAWKARQLDRYMAFYSPEFVNGSKNLNAWHNYKRAVFGSYREMKIDFDMVRVITHPKYALSVMNQDFRGDNRFVSIGRKMLYWLRGSDGNWYITREVFENRKIRPMRFTEAEIANLSSRRSSASISNGTSVSPSL